MPSTTPSVHRGPSTKLGDADLTAVKRHDVPGLTSGLRKRSIIRVTRLKRCHRAQTPLPSSAQQRLMVSRQLYPRPIKNIPPSQIPHHSPRIRSHDNRNRPLLPLAVPVQRDGYGSDPRPYASAQTHAVQLVDRQLQTHYLQPFGRVEAVRVEELGCGEEGEVECEEEGVGVVCC